MKYPLYYTLNKDLKKKSLTQDQKDQIKKYISKKNKEESEDSRIFNEVIIMLVIEHAKVKDDFSIDKLSEAAETQKKIDLPYGLIEKSGNVSFDLVKLPKELQQILWKFITPNL